MFRQQKCERGVNTNDILLMEAFKGSIPSAVLGTNIFLSVKTLWGLSTQRDCSLISGLCVFVRVSAQWYKESTSAVEVCEGNQPPPPPCLDSLGPSGGGDGQVASGQEPHHERHWDVSQGEESLTRTRTGRTRKRMLARTHTHVRTQQRQHQ